MCVRARPHSPGDISHSDDRGCLLYTGVCIRLCIDVCMYIYIYSEEEESDNDDDEAGAAAVAALVEALEVK